MQPPAGLQIADRALYPDPRMFRRLRHAGLFKTALLVLLALGMAVQPVLGAVGDLHGAEHAAQAGVMSDHGHARGGDDAGHGHDHDHDHDTPDPDHAKGSHVLMHLDGGLAVALTDAVVRVPAGIPGAPDHSEVETDGLPVTAPNLPFRPPIA